MTPLSKCCSAPIKTHYADEGTGCWLCESCGKATDPASDNVTPESTPSALTDSQIVERLATEVMGWHVHHEYPEWWNGDRYTGFAIPNHGQDVIREVFDPLTDWNHWRQVEKKVMEDKELQKKYIGNLIHPKGFYVENVLNADLPTRCKALLFALDQ